MDVSWASATRPVCCVPVGVHINLCRRVEFEFGFMPLLFAAHQPFSRCLNLTYANVAAVARFEARSLCVCERECDPLPACVAPFISGCRGRGAERGRRGR